MAIHEFSIETRREVMVALAHHLGIDRPAPPPENGITQDDSRKISRMTLRYRDERGHETELSEWEERDLFGKGVNLEVITRGIELAACRDAAYQFGGDCIYVLAFHGKDHPNRSRFLFKIPGGQEVQHLALAQGNGYGSNRGSDQPGLAERLMPDILRYVQAKEEMLEKRSTTLWDSVIKTNQHYATVITEYTDREAKIRQIELGAEDHFYEREKKRRDEEESAQMKKDAWNLVKENAPKVMPYVLAAVQRLSKGPQPQRPMQRGYVQPGTPGQDPGFDAWYTGQGQAEGHDPTNGRSSTNGHGPSDANEQWYGPGAAMPEGSDPGGTRGAAESDPEPRAAQRDETNVPGPQAVGQEDMVGQVRLRVALDAVRFVMLVRGRGQLESVRGALTGDQLTIFDQIAEAGDKADFDSDKDVAAIADLALAFGGAVQADPAAGFRLLGAGDQMTKLALVDLSNLLKLYFDALQGNLPGN
jgi:hypothetical protein